MTCWAIMSILCALPRCGKLSQMFIKYNISHVLITPAMKEELWNGREEELLLLLRNSDKFEMVNQTASGFELWKYRGNVASNFT